MNTDDLQKIAYEEIGGEEIFDPSPFIIFSRQTDQEEGGLSLAAFNLLRSSLNRGGDGGLAPWPRSCSFINPPASFSSGVYCLLRPIIASLKRSKKINALYRLPFLG